jgi:hypothetical protein
MNNSIEYNVGPKPPQDIDVQMIAGAIPGAGQLDVDPSS